MPAKVEKVLECDKLVEEIADEIKEKNDIFYLGRGIRLCISYGRFFKNKRNILYAC